LRIYIPRQSLFRNPQSAIRNRPTVPTAVTTSPLLDPHTIARLHGLELRARRVVEGYVAGLHRSPYHGFSNEFAEHREYAPGDDLRYVDWKVFGKTDKVYLKQFEVETNLICYLLLDTSESMQYQGPGAPLSKLAYAQCAAAALAYLVLHHRDSVGLVTFDQEVRQLIRPSSNPTQLKQLLSVMEHSTAARKTRTGPIFHDLAERLGRRGIVVVLSDLFDDVEAMLAGLKHLRHRRHDVIVLHILDPAEIDFPFQQITMFKGLEALGEVITEPRSLRAAYQQEVSAFLKRVKTGCRAQQIDYLTIRTDQPLDGVLTAFLSARKRSVK
jgi:uncharacterized protein (DUF58 family)